MTSYWCPQAWLPAGVADRVRITVADGVITAVTINQPPEPDDVRLTGVLLPGLANGHSHAFHRGLRGRTHANGGTFWTWRQQMYALAGPARPRQLPAPRHRRVRRDGAGRVHRGR